MSAFLIMLLMMSGIVCASAEETILVSEDLAGWTPYAAGVRAYSPNGGNDVPVYYSATPEEFNLGDVSENAPNFSAVVQVFEHLALTPYEGDYLPPDGNWHFSIDYTAQDDQKKTHTVRLDFYDYSDVVGYTKLYMPGETVFVTMPLEDSLALEEIYINVVCRLHRVGLITR